jgi:hypothetical protein
MRHPKRFVKQSRLQLSDGTRLGSQFSERVLAALDRAFWLEGLPPLRRDYVRFQASDKSIHDVPAKHLNQALGIDQRWCYGTGTPLNFRILENTALREHDRQVMRTFRYLLIAAQDL